ncbi:hypothetical protein BGI33_03120 [Snodgrassella alvi]|nr:hypothetical protein BGI33_09825 [Snodgrassella alvi]PIT17267.1 hypothetical protein BGI34_07490 [Snodgrassella alvi]PIT17333.1 hypothetical protein BGI33_03120 [Snodgrassella alvi]PIT17436.1 hypothetical protein BGI34_07180 [Snodgrassella alvi]PIT20829.1 hypothetical protein BGI34_02065 [Snodgrassella alvi]
MMRGEQHLVNIIQCRYSKIVNMVGSYLKQKMVLMAIQGGDLVRVELHQHLKNQQEVYLRAQHQLVNITHMVITLILILIERIKLVMFIIVINFLIVILAFIIVLIKPFLIIPMY